MYQPVDETQCDVTIKPIHTQNCLLNCSSKRKSDWKILSRSGVLLLSLVDKIRF
jgi:hypothetical protein